MKKYTPYLIGTGLAIVLLFVLWPYIPDIGIKGRVTVSTKAQKELIRQIDSLNKVITEDSTTIRQLKSVQAIQLRKIKEYTNEINDLINEEAENQAQQDSIMRNIDSLDIFGVVDQLSKYYASKGIATHNTSRGSD